jgi:hypothetical protein
VTCNPEHGVKVERGAPSRSRSLGAPLTRRTTSQLSERLDERAADRRQAGDGREEAGVRLR